MPRWLDCGIDAAAYPLAAARPLTAPIAQIRYALRRPVAAGTAPAPPRGMNDNEIKGKAKNLKGRVKEGVGAVTGNKHLQSEGAAERIGGAAEEKIGEVRRKAGEALEDAGEDIKR